MGRSDPRKEVDALLERLKGSDNEHDPQVPFAADRRHLVMPC